ncbi:GAF domain-containing protein [Arboricoccus pini]|uniref:histidine kinase n=1 Tax=Arboricoccus pini TaxID=1963835 RepID=A0A212RQ26_9PROT|nr:DAHL domain-containing protein [Arboricoccus pini]SNB74673.1 GAF domain-containing protein [Arboricoccus pini]
MKRVALIAVALFLLLTFLLVQTRPALENARHNLDLVRDMVMTQASLQKLVLAARSYLVANDDPIVAAMDRLRDDGMALTRDSNMSPTEMALTDKVAETLRVQESQVFAFTASNATVRNSVAYFSQLIAHSSQRSGPFSDAVGPLANAMMGFAMTTAADADEHLRELLTALDRRVQAQDDDGDMRAMLAHGRMIERTLPAVDQMLRTLAEDRAGQSINALQATLNGEVVQMEAQSARWRLALYTVALGLLGMFVFLYGQVRRSARLLDLRAKSLESRLALEQMVVGLSSMLVGVPADSVQAAIEDGLAILARHFEADRVYFLATHPSYGERHFAIWTADDVPDDEAQLAWAEAALTLFDDESCPRQESVAIVDRVSQLPSGPFRQQFEANGVRSWLGVSVMHRSLVIGIMGLDRLRVEKPWPAENIGLMRMVADTVLQAWQGRLSSLERDRLTSRLHHAQRVQAVGTIASGVAHNFNNILGAILGYAEMALEQTGPGSTAGTYVREILSSGRRAADVVEQILTLSRQRDHHLQQVELGDLLDETIRLLEISLAAKVAYVVHKGTSPLTVAADPAEVQQVIMNLARNAAQAMDGEGQVTISLDLEVVTAPRQLSHGELATGAYARLCVEDHGVGMSRAVIENIFEPFFTTKDAGTGLGLATIRVMVTEHQGAIDVESEPGRGSVFTVYLPHAQQVANLPGRTGSTFQGQGEIVMIVDDEVGLLRITEEAVASMGCEPMGFSDPHAALAALAAAPDRFDLVLTDEVMPRMKGIELAARVNAIVPDLPIVLMTGLVSLPSVELIQRVGIKEVVRKPLLAADLRAVLERQLNPAPQAGTEGRALTSRTR